MASSATYRSIDIGTNTRIGSPAISPLAVSIAAARAAALSSSRKLSVTGRFHRHSVKQRPRAFAQAVKRS